MSYAPITAHIEEFQSGAWVADMTSTESFPGLFMLPDGSTWLGTTVSERFDKGTFHTRVIGGKNKLGSIIPDQYYSGSVTLQQILGDICTAAGETVGVAPIVTMNNYQRLKGSASSALGALVNAQPQPMLWWIDRSGLVQVALVRPLGQDATGLLVHANTDGSLVLFNPNGVALGVAYDTSDPFVSLPTISHVRWRLTEQNFTAELYPSPFVFQPETVNYSCMYKASIVSNNGDGTVDVIADNRFSVSSVPLYCGVPGSKVTMDPGEQVALGFFGANPQSPFCLGMAQSASATAQVARNNDQVQVTIPAASFLISCSGSPAVGVLNPDPINVTGTIQSGTSRISTVS